jgi:hypothetical protein
MPGGLQVRELRRLVAAPAAGQASGTLFELHDFGAFHLHVNYIVG